MWFVFKIKQHVSLEDKPPVLKEKKEKKMSKLNKKKKKKIVRKLLKNGEIIFRIIIIIF